MNYFQIAGNVVQNHQKQVLKKIQEGRCVRCGVNEARSELLCDTCHQHEMIELLELAKEVTP